MVKHAWRSRVARTGIAAGLAALGLMPYALSSPVARAEIDGNTYTSPRFGYSVTWTDAWYVVDESSESSGEVDQVVVSDGVTYAAVAAFAEPGIDPKRALIEMYAAIRTDRANDNVVRDPDTRVPVDIPATCDWATMQMSYTQTGDDGSTYDVIELDAACALVPGESVVVISAASLADYFVDEAPAIAELWAGIRIGTAATITDTESAGEPAPVFASGRWRVAVAAVAEADEFGDFGLAAKAGKSWLVLVADVTNWSADGGTFVGREFRLRTGRGTFAKAAPVSTAQAEQGLDLADYGQGLTMAVGAGETVRVVLVFSVPEGEDPLALTHGDQALPLDDATVSALDAAALPALATPPDVTEAELVSASDGRTLRVQPKGESASQRIRLLGVQPPADDACYGAEAEKALDALAGRRVLVEEDSQLVERSGTPVRYLWLVEPDGTRTLINADLIATGRAAAAELPADARFGAWLRESERAAKAAPVGQWADCGGGATGTGAGSPRATPDTSRGTDLDASPSADADGSDPELGTGGFAFSAATRTVSVHTRMSLRPVNAGTASHAFAIDGLDPATRAVEPAEVRAAPG